MYSFGNFKYYNPTNIIFGKGGIAEVAELIAKDKKVLMIYGGGSIKKNGVYEQVQAALGDHNWLEFSGIEANPTQETLDKAVKIVRDENIDFILAVGGGSVIDGGKYIAAASLYDGDGWDILEWKHIVNEAVPLGAVLTIPATGSESNSGSVVSRAATKEKRFFKSDAVFPVFAVMDYTVMSTLDDRQLANGLADTFVHICEQYLTKTADAYVQDGYAEVLLRSVVKLAANWEDRHSEVWQKNLMWTSNQALNGLIGLGVLWDGSTHMIGHEITALYGIDHARTLAIVQPSMLRVMIDDKSEKLIQMGGNVFGFETADAELVINAIEAMYHGIGIKTKLSEYVQEADIPALIASLEKHGMTKLGENGSITPEKSEEILKRSL
jgi:NADP-dependent alcohol dehydrogenase